MELHFSPVRLKSGRRKPFYRCVNFPECDAAHGAHPDGAPMGIPADRETRKLRIEAHKALDRVFPFKKKWGREETYRWLGENGFGHIASMNAEECREIIEKISHEKPRYKI